MSKQRGFSLFEMLIVVLLIVVLVVLAVASLLATRKAANETSAVTSLRTLHSVQDQYRSRFGLYAGSLGDLGVAGYIDTVLAQGQKSGYDFVNLSATSGNTWSVQAEPATPGTTGDRYFFTDETGVIRFSSSGSAGAGDPAVN